MAKYKKLTYLQAALKEAGYTHSDLAEKLNITAESISNKFRGVTDWRMYELEKLLELLPDVSSEEKIRMLNIF